MTRPECRGCHRRITDVAAAEKRDGYGPRCWKARQPQPLGAILRKLPFARRAAEIAAGQLAIDEEVDGGDL